MTTQTIPTASLKAKTTIYCFCCGDPMKRVKTIKVSATTKEAAKAEANEIISKWTLSLKGQNCKVCNSIING